ncbi:MAG: SDR family NAD(P)-dependent oxidoreductase [Halioglobus sp.]
MSYFGGKHAVITGAGSGLGRALALKLNARGCSLWLSDINEDNLEQTRAALSKPSLPVDTQTVDVADRDAVHAWAQRVSETTAHVDLVVNNAGVALMATVEDNSYEDLEWLMNINFWGVVHGTKAFLPLLRASKQGHLVNISSVFGMISAPTQSAYNAAKFAVRGYTEALRHEMADTNVHVMCVHPGGIKTNIVAGARGIADADRQQASADFTTFAKTTPDSAAQQLLKACEKKKKRLMIGNDARYIALLTRLFPVNYAKFLPMSELK